MMLDRLHSKAAQWKVAIDETHETESSVLGFGVREGRPIVLKLTRTPDEARAGEMLRAFAGNGAVRVYEYEPGAVLLERLEPGQQLVELVRRGEDDTATRIIAELIAKLAHHSPPPDTPAVSDWGRGFERYLKSGDHPISHDLIREAQQLYNDLALSQRTTMLLHGDLQHYNVLYDNLHGWTAIDPKGVVGEIEYEIGALLRNPIEQPELFTNRATIARRLEILTNLLALNPSRTLRWCFAQAVLSAVWDVEDGHHVNDNHPALLLARTLEPMLD
ncbi:MAG TPA: aminoglycoside phosphotransferase family protein [Pyrinomonadaceae bacterium]|nr:aminoglycoside phosphotransferase family protein [Pyrinomonadaceae bacterium]